MLKMAKKAYKRRTAEQKQKQVEDLFQTLEEGVKNFSYDPDKYKAILEMQALMPNYSFRNIILAKIQLPGARFIASFQRWKELNRKVIKGEKALRILAPRFKKVEDEETGEEEQRLIGFVSVPVFDYSQTEGESLPIDRIKLTLDGNSEEAINIFDWAKKLAMNDDCPMRIEHIKRGNGYYSPSSHEIVIHSELSINHRAKTAVHELVHSRVHRNLNQSTNVERECVAEGVAFIVCSYFGLDTSDFSFEYVKGWSKDEGQLMKYGGTIQRVANQLIDDFKQIIATEDSSHEFIKQEKDDCLTA